MSTGIKIVGNGGNGHVAFCSFNGFDVAVEAEGLEGFSACGNVHNKNGKSSTQSEQKSAEVGSLDHSYSYLVGDQPLKPLSYYQYDYKNLEISFNGFGFGKEV